MTTINDDFLEAPLYPDMGAPLPDTRTLLENTLKQALWATQGLVIAASLDGCSIAPREKLIANLQKVNTMILQLDSYANPASETRIEDTLDFSVEDSDYTAVEVSDDYL